jgi:hypothetical protein
VKTRAPDLEAETALDFASKSAPQVFERQFENIGEYALLTDSALQSIPMDRDWTSFYSQFPDAPGMVSFSNVGFNRAGTQAAVFMMHTRAALWGEMSFYLLRKTAAGWEIAQRVPVLAS